MSTDADALRQKFFPPALLYSYLDDPMPGGRQTHDAALVGLCLVLQCPMLDTLTSYNT